MGVQVSYHKHSSSLVCPHTAASTYSKTSLITHNSLGLETSSQCEDQITTACMFQWQRVKWCCSRSHAGALGLQQLLVSLMVPGLIGSAVSHHVHCQSSCVLRSEFSLRSCFSFTSCFWSSYLFLQKCPYSSSPATSCTSSGGHIEASQTPACLGLPGDSHCFTLSHKPPQHEWEVTT